MDEQPFSYIGRTHNVPPMVSTEGTKTGSSDMFRVKVPWEMILIWAVIVVALALVAVATVLLFLGLLEMIAVVSPVLVAILLVWCALLTARNVALSRRVSRLEGG